MKNGTIRLVITVTGADGYAATYSWAEIAPDFGARPALLAVTEDGRQLPRPRTTAPGDRKGGRYVSDIVRITVIDPVR